MTLGRTCFSLLLPASLLFAEPTDDKDSWSALIDRAGVLRTEGKFAIAASTAKRALVLAKASTSQTATTKYVLGSIHRDWGHCTEAQTNYSAAATLWQTVPDAKPEYVFSSILCMIACASDCGNAETVERLYSSNLATLQRYRTGPLDDAKLLALQAGLARSQNRFAEAEEEYRRALALMSGMPEAKPTDIAELITSMAVMMATEGKLEESLAESQRAIMLLESVNPQYVTMPSTMNNAACQLFRLGRKEESARMFRGALDLAIHLYGDENRITGKIMLNYAALLRDSKELTAADALKQKGMEAYRRAILRDTQVVDASDLLSGRR